MGIGGRPFWAILAFALAWLVTTPILCWACSAKTIALSASVVAPTWTGLIALMCALYFPAVRVEAGKPFLRIPVLGKWIWALNRSRIVWWLDFKVHAGKLNQALDQNIWWSLSTWVLGTGSAGIVALALDDKYHKILPKSFPLDANAILQSRPLVWSLLMVAPVLGLAKKGLRKLEVRDALAERRLLDVLAENSGEFASKLAREISRARDGTPEASDRFFQRALEELAGHIALAFASIADVELSSMKVIPCIFQDSELIDVSIRGPAAADAKSPLTELADERTTIMKCHKKAGSIVISDIELELTKRSADFWPTPSNPDGAKGSIICYPVKLSNGKICCVISVHCQEPRKFFTSYRKFYDRELGTFGRLLVISTVFARILREDANDATERRPGNAG